MLDGVLDAVVAALSAEGLNVIREFPERMIDLASEAVLARVSDALSKYFNGTLLVKNLLRARLGQIVFGVEGVLNYCILLPESDVSIAETELPVAGSITVTEGGVG